MKQKVIKLIQEKGVRSYARFGTIGPRSNSERHGTALRGRRGGRDPAIMHKVRQIHQKKQGRNAGNRKKTLIIAMLTAILILSSISAYASQYLIQIKNNEGEVILSTIKPWKYSSRNITPNVKETEEELSKRLKPGEQAVYYIKDQHLTSSTRKYPLNYFYMATKHPNYQELAKEIEEKDAPLLRKPDYVPEGYRFDFGRIQIRNEPVWEHRGTKVF